MIGVYAFCISYAVTDWLFLLFEALGIALTPLVTLLVIMPVSAAITIGITIQDGKNKGR